MLKQCHKELDGNKAVGIDKVTKDEYGKNLTKYQGTGTEVEKQIL